MRIFNRPSARIVPGVIRDVIPGGLPAALALTMTLMLAAGCATVQPPAAPALNSTARDQIGHLAIREPAKPPVTLTSELLGRGAAARKTAVSAGMGWLGGSLEAAGQSNDEGAVLVAMFGLLTTPIVAAGGAVYGAAAADSPAAVAAGNEVVEQSLDFSAAQLRQALAGQFAESARVSHEFVAHDASNAELVARGFDSVLDVEMHSITSSPSADALKVAFTTSNSVRLTSLASGQVLLTRQYRRELAPRSISGWASHDAEALTAALAASFDDIAVDLSEELFIAEPVRLKGLEPVSRSRFATGTIPGVRPMFVWSALDGGQTPAAGSLEYELLLQAGASEQRVRTRATRYVPDGTLEPCRTYRWQVRAHYESFGEAEQSDWSPEYRFRTACDR